MTTLKKHEKKQITSFKKKKETYYIIKFLFLLFPKKKVTFMSYLVKILNIPVMFRAETKDYKPYLLCKQHSLQGKNLLTLNAVPVPGSWNFITAFLKNNMSLVIIINDYNQGQERWHFPWPALKSLGFLPYACPGLCICQTRLQVFMVEGFLGGMMWVCYFLYLVFNQIFCLCALLGKA